MNALSLEDANKIFDILRDECGAREQDREHFVIVQTNGVCGEFRFGGKLGFGGKFYRGIQREYVSCYSEDLTPERTVMIEKANVKLVRMAER